MYTHLRGVVSKNTIDHTVVEYDRVKCVGIDKSECHCTIRKIHSVPYTCEIAKYCMIPCPIMFEVFQVWLRKFNFHYNGLSKLSELSLKHEIDVTVKTFDELDIPRKFSLEGKLCEIVYLSIMSICPIVDNVKKKEAPTKRKK